MVAALSVSCAQTPKVNAPEPTRGQIDSVSYLIGVNFGYFIKANSFADNLSELNMGDIKKGMQDFIGNKAKMGSDEFNANFKINPDLMNEIFSEFIKTRNEHIAAVNDTLGKQFLEKVYNKGGVEKSESGLIYQIIEAGDEVKAGPQDTVYCHYKGTLIDGTEFDASNPEGEPVALTLNRVIPGWTEGLQLVGQGGKIKLYVPASLGYGENGTGTIAPNSALIFDVELVKVGKYVEPEEDAETEE